MASRPPIISRSAALQLGAVGVIAVATIASGGTLAPLLAGALGTGLGKGITDLAGESLKGLIPNLLSNIFSRWTEKGEENRRRRAERKQNHDLQRAINTAIARCVSKAAETYKKSEGGKAYLNNLAKALEKDPLSLDLKFAAGAEAIDESRITPILSGDIAILRERKPLTIDEWRTLIGHFGHGLGESTMDKALTHVAEHTHEHFVTTLIETMKSMGVENDPAWFALVIRFLGDIHAGVQCNSAALAKLQESFDTHREEVRNAFQRLHENMTTRSAGATVADVARLQADTEQLGLIRELAERLAADMPDIKAELDLLLENMSVLQAGIKRLSSQIGGLSTQVADHAAADAAAHAETQRLFKQYAPSPLPPTRSNFGALAIARNIGFVGRETELGDLRRVMSAGEEAAALTQGFTGEGGIGKSQLAQRFAEKSCTALGGGKSEQGVDWNLFDCAWWLDGSQTGHAGAVRALAEHLGHTPGKDDSPSDLRRTVRTILADGRRHLLILDNLEQSAPPANPSEDGHDPWDIARELTLPAPSRVLITTLEQFLPGNLAHCVELGVLDREDARKLLRQGRDDLSDSNHDAALDAVTEHLGRLALAVDMARAWLVLHPGKSPATLLTELKQSDAATLALFEKEELKGQAGGYRRSVAATLSLHMKGLEGSPAERVLFAAAFAAPDRIPAELLGAAAGLHENEVSDALFALTRKSIVHHQPGDFGGFVSIHRLTQLVARARLTKTSGKDQDNVLEVWLDALIALFRWPKAELELWDHTRTPERAAALLHAETVIEHAAPASTLRRDVARLRGELSHRLKNFGQLTSAASHVDAAIAWGEAQSPRDERSLAIRYASRASIRQYRGDLKGAEEDIARSIQWGEAQSPRDERALAIQYASRANIRQDRGDLGRAEEDIARSIQWGEAQSPRDERCLGIFYDWRARIRRSIGKLHDAEGDINESIRLGELQTPQDEHDLTIRYASRASIRQDRGDLKGAEEDIARSIQWGEAQSPRDERGLAIWYAARASIRQDRGDLKGAEEDIARAIKWEVQQDRPNDRELAIRYASRASIRHARGDLIGAEEDIAHSIQMGRSPEPAS